MRLKNLRLVRLAIVAAMGVVSTGMAQAQSVLHPVVVDNTSTREATVKVAGPLNKKFTLSRDTTVTLMVPAGTYQFFYQFESTDEDGKYIYSKTPECVIDDKDHSPYFTVLAYPWEISTGVYAPQNRIKPITAEEFAGAGGNQLNGDALSRVTEQLDGLRFAEIDVVASIGELYEAETDRARARTAAIVKPYLIRYISQHVLPRLRKQGFKATFLGIMDEPPRASRPTLTILYEENEGDPFTFNYQETVHGVDIVCTLSLEAPLVKLSGPIWKEKFFTGTASDLKASIVNPMPTFRRNALVNLGYHFEDNIIDLSDWKPK